ncbi:MAG: hypothetical protein K1X95_06120 [Acidimicrobiia bacterium]|nr:hypothetical protein [Acidimicrobiia bacterium]
MCDHCGCRSFAPIAELTAEHEEILAAAWELAESGRSGHAIPTGTQERLLVLLEVHAAKEETGLYPELVGLGGLTAQDCAGLEAEHRALRAAIASGAFDRRGYYELAAHIEVEELELFSAARFSFDEHDWDAMAGAHAAQEAIRR